VNKRPAMRDGVMPKLMLITGGLWIFFALAFLLILADYVARGAGVQLFGNMPLLGFVDIAARLLIGWIHVIGIFMAAIISFSIGIGLCAYGMTGAPR
jgi:hypothetical protein